MVLNLDTHYFTTETYNIKMQVMRIVFGLDVVFITLLNSNHIYISMHIGRARSLH